MTQTRPSPPYTHTLSSPSPHPFAQMSGKAQKAASQELIIHLLCPSCAVTADRGFLVPSASCPRPPWGPRAGRKEPNRSFQLELKPPESLPPLGATCSQLCLAFILSALVCPAPPQHPQPLLPTHTHTHTHTHRSSPRVQREVLYV